MHRDGGNDQTGIAELLATKGLSLAGANPEKEAVSSSHPQQGGDNNTERQPPTSDVGITSKKPQISPKEQVQLQPGDHVYQWCSLLGIPGVFQHHGIVMEVEDTTVVETDGTERVEQVLTIADFSNLLFGESSSPSSSNVGNKKKTVDEMQAEYCDRGSEAMEDDSYDYTNDDDDMSDLTMSAITPLEEEISPTVTTNTTSVGSLPFLRSGKVLPSSSPSSVLPRKEGGLRVYQTTSSEGQWHKVCYQDHWFHTHLWKRSGTCTPATSDPPEVVLQRVRFLLSHSGNTSAGCAGGFVGGVGRGGDHSANNNQSIVPPYHSIFSNCECVSVWAKTGTWSTLQAASFLSHAAIGQVKGTATLATFAAAQTVTVPAAGVWGWMGYTSSIPLVTVQPLLLPAICAYGALSIGGPAVCLAVAKSKWRETTQRLNAALAAEQCQMSPMVS